MPIRASVAYFCLDPNSDPDPGRTEAIPCDIVGMLEGKLARFHGAYTYRFSVLLFKDQTRHGGADSFAQWHGVPDLFLGQNERSVGPRLARYFRSVSIHAG